AAHATKSVAAEKPLPLLAVVALNAEKVSPTLASARTPRATTRAAIGPDLRPDHTGSLLRLGVPPPDRGDLERAQQEEGGHDQEHAADGGVDPDQDVAELHDPESHHAEGPA